MREPIPVVSAILANARGEVLLQLRDDRLDLLFPGFWTVPGGAAEPGETPDEAISRELFEEMALRLPLTYWKNYTSRRGHHDEIEVFQHIYTGLLDRPAESIPLYEGQALHFFSAAQIETMSLGFGFGPVLWDYFEWMAGEASRKQKEKSNGNFSC